VFAFGANDCGQCGVAPRHHRRDDRHHRHRQHHDDHDNDNGNGNGNGNGDNNDPNNNNAADDDDNDNGPHSRPQPQPQSHTLPMDVAGPAPVPHDNNNDGNNNNGGNDNGNGNGDDGDDYDNDYDERPTSIVRVRGLEMVRCIDIAAGCQWSAAVADNGMIYTWGQACIQDDEEKYQLGHDGIRSDVEEKQLEHNWQLLCDTNGDDGQPFAGAHPRNGALNVYAALPCVAYSVPYIHGRVIRISLGDGFSVVLTDIGRVYSMGRNHNGQLGVGHRDTCESAQPILFPTTVVPLPSGSAESKETKTAIAIGVDDADGNDNDNGNDDDDDDDDDGKVSTSTSTCTVDGYSNDINIVSIVCGESMTYALSHDGRLFTWVCMICLYLWLALSALSLSHWFTCHYIIHLLIHFINIRSSLSLH
jgi:hypothetical protein